MLVRCPETLTTSVIDIVCSDVFVGMVVALRGVVSIITSSPLVLTVSAELLGPLLLGVVDLGAYESIGLLARRGFIIIA